MEAESASDHDFALDDDGDSDYERRRRKRHKPSGGTSTTGEKALDRISSLPESVLIHIISILPTKYAIRTCILAKKWRYLWTSSPILDFLDPVNWHEYGRKENLQRFVSFVNRTLILNEAHKVKTFRVELTYREAFASNVDVWMRFATRKNVEELALSFIERHPARGDKDDDYYSMYVLPRYMFRNSSLVTLKLSYCVIEQCVPISWSSLKVLSLSKMELTNDMIREMLLGCPLIEVLELCDCFYYNVLDITSETLRKLVVNGYMGPSCSTLNISAPNIQSLEISGFLNVTKISIINLTSLVEAKLTFRQTSRPGIKECAKIVREMVENLRHVKDLTVGYWFLQILSVLEKKALPSSFLNITSLRIETELNKWELPGITTLLSLTPQLDTLVIAKKCSVFQLSQVFELEPVLLESFEFDPKNYWTSQQSLFASALLNLKTIKFVQFVGLNEDIEFASFLLKNARCLEKMIFYRVWFVKKRFMAEAFEKKMEESLLSLPRCPHDAVVLIS